MGGKDCIAIRLLWSVILCGLTSCQTIRPEVKRSVYPLPCQVAVLPFYGEEPFRADVANALISQLIDTGYAVIERSALPEILQEQALQYTGHVDPRTAIEMGRIAGVDYIVMGSIRTRPQITFVNWLFGDGIPEDDIDLVQARFVNVQSGRIIASVALRNLRQRDINQIARTIVSEFDRTLVNYVSTSGGSGNGWIGQASAGLDIARAVNKSAALGK